MAKRDMHANDNRTYRDEIIEWADYPRCPPDDGPPIEGDEDTIDRRRLFADPGGKSALRAASARNPRNLPCPTCGKPNKLTPADKARGYQCDDCANQEEGP